MTASQMLPRAALMLTVVGFFHWVIYRGLVTPAALPGPWPAIAAGVLGAGILMVIGLMLWAHGRTGEAVKLGQHVVYVYLGGFMYALFLSLFLISVRGLGDLYEAVVGTALLATDDPIATARRASAGALLVLVAVVIVSTVQGLRAPRVVRVDVTLDRLPEAFDGYTIVQLTDLHVGPMRDNAWLTEVVTEVNALSPDLVAITGDLFEAPADVLVTEGETLSGLGATDGVFFVTGNHEYYIDPMGWLRRLPELGIQVLSNTHQRVTRDGASLVIAGVNDPDGALLGPEHRPDLAAALRGVSETDEVVLLAHQPRVVGRASDADVGLVLSGHTHAGQLWPFRYLVYLQQPIVEGLKRRGRTQIYVSHGTGFWGPPMRLGSRSEITHITLHASA